ncbi:PaaI family thioesterase [Hymenobacter lutimineralis]|uniref:PaaI family thioesterase n=1 Tax=Hymenobacter lutimineralis TaxID=2606448 RepID=A0A5D6V9L4_9BACT|nr:MULTISPECIES: PaaI family thioesterase [Hymenobacter]QIX61920.1 PaaI family thioesterase [Hymenobacter sp. BT18]TYZ12573.1 PaaI family thioesterase [Hymenobacter lutimineralis]
MEPLPDVATLVAIYNQINQYGRTNGMALRLVGSGQVEYSMTVLPEHLSSPGTCHGGVLAGLMDSALGAAALALAFTEGELVSTVEFKINYLHPVRLHDQLVARARVVHSGKSLVVAEGDIFCATRELVVACGLGTFNRYPATKREFRNLLFPSADDSQE